jgi:hypothetical protein
MLADVIMVRHDPIAPWSHNMPGPRLGARRRLGDVIRRQDPGVVVLVGFGAAMGWAFVGSLLLGLGAGATSRITAWLWLAGELLVGTAMFAALILGAPPGRGDGA